MTPILRKMLMLFGLALSIGCGNPAQNGDAADAGHDGPVDVAGDRPGDGPPLDALLDTSIVDIVDAGVDVSANDSSEAGDSAPDATTDTAVDSGTIDVPVVDVIDVTIDIVPTDTGPGPDVLADTPLRDVQTDVPACLPMSARCETNPSACCAGLMCRPAFIGSICIP